MTFYIRTENGLILLPSDTEIHLQHIKILFSLYNWNKHLKYLSSGSTEKSSGRLIFRRDIEK